MEDAERESWGRLRELFRQASRLDPAKRRAFLASRCPEDDALHPRLAELLAAHDQAQGFLERSMASAGTAGELELPVGEWLGDYQLRRIIGRGGMGTVFEAVQRHPRRTVALKVMTAAIASSVALRRFEHEARILALLQHQGIAQVYAADVHEFSNGARVPYFVMEFVPDSRTIVDFADAVNLGLRERLRLFADVCDAVHHGHQKGIIHRDLKPGNILVGPDGRPKVIDFGVARGTDSDVAVSSMTEVGQLVGTLQYMSPEQFGADPDDLDTRSDVYALGVVLFELLCGQLPYEIHHDALGDAARIVREQAPTRPSTIDRSIRGDVETIVLKALEKQRDRRYRSAVELADDIRRYLNREPIIARPPSMTYQLRMFARRNKAIVAGVAATLLMLVLGIAGTAWQAAAARREAALARQVSGFLESLFTQSDPVNALGQDVTARELLDAGAERIEALADQPVAQARLMWVLGNVYLSVGDPAKARELQEQALAIRRRELGPRHSDVGLSLGAVGVASYDLGEFQRAREMLEQALPILERTLPPDAPLRISTMNDLGNVYHDLGELERSRAILKRALEIQERSIGWEDPEIGGTANNLAAVHLSLGEVEPARELFIRVADLLEREFGPVHPYLAAVSSNIGALSYRSGDYEAARRWLERSLAIDIEMKGPDDAAMAVGHLHLGNLFIATEDWDDSRTHFERALELSRAEFGTEHPDVATALHGLCKLGRNLGELEQAESRCREALRIREGILPGDHAHIGSTLGLLAGVLAQERRDAEVEALFERALTIQRRQRTEPSSDYLETLERYGAWLRETGRTERAVEIDAELVAGRSKGSDGAE